VTPALILAGTLRLSGERMRRTAGLFSRLIRDNTEVFSRHFGVELFPGSLSVDVQQPPSLQTDFDAGKPTPSIIIPKGELINMPSYIGDGQAWPSKLRGVKFPAPARCWIFRRIGSRVSAGVIELVAEQGLRQPYGLQHGDAVSIEVFSSERVPAASV